MGDRDELFFERLRGLVEEHGFAVQGVFPTKPGQVGWSYTVGLWPKYGYEIIVFMLDPRIAHAILHAIVRTLKAGAEIPVDTKLRDEPGSLNKWVQGYPVLFKQCLPEKLVGPDLYVNVATQFHGQGVPFRQLVLCDQHGYFPGEPGYSMTQQPILYEV